MKLSSTTQKLYRGQNQRGIALLLTLGILLLLTLLALAFSSSQLTENEAARNFHFGAKAEEIALGGLEDAIAVLSKDVSENPQDRRSSNDHLFERWAIYYQDDDGFAGKDVDLSDYDELEYGVDEGSNILNLSARKDPWKDPRPDSRWTNVIEQDPATRQERLVGRYAVCIEDENSKVNINTAGNPDPLSARWLHRQHMGFTTAEIDLGAVFADPRLGLGELFNEVFPSAENYPHNVDTRTATDIVAYRYGSTPGSLSDRVPGKPGDDNSPSQMPSFLRQDLNGIDDDGDGLIDESGEEEDEPGEFDPYEPSQIRAPGDIVSIATSAGLTGNDTQYLTVPHVRLAKSLFMPGQFSFSIMDKDHASPYPRDRLYRSLLPYITVYSQNLNRFSNRDVGIGGARGRIEWMIRENIARWLDRGHSEVYDFLRPLKSRDIAFSSTTDTTLRQIALNIYDFIDPDWLPTNDGDLAGIEPTAYLNEVEATPELVAGAQIGIEGLIEDYGEYIELWNPYDIPIDLANYYATIDSGAARRIRDFATGSTIVQPRGFFLIGDTLGDIVNVGQNTRSPDQTLPPWPPGCQAYAPLKLAPTQDIVLEIRIGRRGTRVVEKSRYSLPTGFDNVTAQKDDPRMPEWNNSTKTPGGMNVGLTNRDPLYTYFYMPGIAARARDATFNPSDPTMLEHGGGLATVGELGMAHRARQWQSLNFTGSNLYEPRDKDDARLLDLLTLPYQYKYDGQAASADKWPARGAVPGRININTAPPEVLLGLNWYPMFEELKSYNLRVSPALRYDMIQHIISLRRNDPFADMPHVARGIAEHPLLRSAPEAAKEAFMRYNSNLITTRSSVFKISVLAEAFDRRGNLASTRKLEAVVDRGYTPGSLGRNNEPSPTRKEQIRAETATMLHFRWVSQD